MQPGRHLLHGPRGSSSGKVFSAAAQPARYALQARSPPPASAQAVESTATELARPAQPTCGPVSGRLLQRYAMRRWRRSAAIRLKPGYACRVQSISSQHSGGVQGGQQRGGLPATGCMHACPRLLQRGQPPAVQPTEHTLASRPARYSPGAACPATKFTGRAPREGAPSRDLSRSCSKGGRRAGRCASALVHAPQACLTSTPSAPQSRQQARRQHQVGFCNQAALRPLLHPPPESW